MSEANEKPVLTVLAWTERWLESEHEVRVTIEMKYRSRYSTEVLTAGIAKSMPRHDDSGAAREYVAGLARVQIFADAMVPVLR
jgi:hypothetical protein